MQMTTGFKNFTVTGSATLDMRQPTQSAGIVNYGPDTVYVTTDDTVDQSDQLRLISGQTAEFYSTTPFTRLYFTTIGTAEVQVMTNA